MNGDTGFGEITEAAPPTVDIPGYQKAQDDLAEMVSGLGGALQDGIPILPPDVTDEESLAAVAEAWSKLKGKDITAADVAAYSFIAHADTSLPEGTRSQLLAPEYPNEVLVEKRAQERTRAMLADPASAINREFNAAVNAAKGDPALIDQAQQAFYQAQNDLLAQQRARAFQEQTGIAQQKLFQRIKTSMSAGFKQGGQYVPDAAFLGRLIADAAGRDPGKVLEFMSGFQSSAVEQTMLPVILEQFIMTPRQRAEKRWGMEMGRLPYSAMQQELANWLGEDPSNTAKLKELIGVAWGEAQAVQVPTTPMGSPLASIWEKQMEKYYAGVYGGLQTTLKGALGIKRFGVTMGMEEAMTEEEKAAYLQALRKYQGIFGGGGGLEEQEMFAWQRPTELQLIKEREAFDRLAKEARKQTQKAAAVGMGGPAIVFRRKRGG